MDTDTTVDLTRAPGERWQLSTQHVAHARQLIDFYFKDLGVTDEVAETVLEMGRPVVPEPYWEEIESIATQIGVTPARALIGNAYYDLIKSEMGCTAFAADTPDGPLHARNLDWWTEGGLLQNTTALTRFEGGPAGVFFTVGWPGFIGAFSGMAPGRFAVTLNAVLSEEPAQLAMPVVLLIRKVLEDAVNYQEAVERLSITTIPCDCLLLVSGIKRGEMCVIERTPTKYERRGPESGAIVVANDYLLMNYGGVPRGELQESSCGRFDRISSLIREGPTTLGECLGYLNDPQVRMGITVQQMAFRTQSGNLLLGKPWP